MHSKVTSTVLLLTLLIVASSARAEVTIQDDGAFVLDRADIVDASTEAKLISWLDQLEQKSTVRVKLLTVSTIDGEDFMGFVQRHADLWGLNKEDGSKDVLITLALQERKTKIQAGQGLAGVLPDSWCESTYQDVAERFFKQGHYSQGLEELVTLVVNEVAEDAGVQVAGVPQRRHQAEPKRRDRSFLYFLAFIGILMLLNFFTRPGRRRRHATWLSDEGWGKTLGGDSMGSGGFGGGGTSW